MNKFYYCTGICLVLFAFLAESQAELISDSEFDDQDWSSTPLLRESPDSYTQSSEQVLTGGNSGAYRQMIHSWSNVSWVCVFHIFNETTYDPSTQGAIASIDYSADHILISNTASGVVGNAMAIEQDGILYLGNEALHFQTGGFNNSTWDTYSKDNLISSDFYDVNQIQSPDFSATGGVMKFGYVRTSKTSGGPATVVHGIDNWMVNITPVPEPTALVLLVIGALGLLAVARRR